MSDGGYVRYGVRSADDDVVSEAAVESVYREKSMFE